MKNKLLWGLLWLSLATPAQAQQEDRSDWQAWYDATLKLDLKKGWEISAQYRLRMVENAAQYRGSYFFAQVDKRLNQHIALQGGYRLALVNDWVAHRVALGVEARQQFESFTLAFRPMFQYQNQLRADDDEQGTTSNSYLRTRLTGRYKLNKRWDVYAYSEPFFAFYRYELPFYARVRSFNLDRWRNAAGVRWQLTKGTRASLYYLWFPDYGDPSLTRQIHVLGLDLDFTLKPGKK
ncbi:MAG: DUF2490 domain-containing protein [Bernardetiaceae bacterium]|jgi:hypothetical protein|nr:DUF2490 domain-containing protein [Bernardetiaceae bacterium]